MRLKNILGWMIMICVLLGCNRSSSFTDTQGHKIDLAAYRGQWIVINYWASWCDHCLAEIPELNAFYLAHQGQDAVVLGVNQDPVAPEELPALVKKVGIKYPVLTTDPAASLGLGTAPGLPITYLINPEGRLQGPLLGEQTQAELEKIMGLVKKINLSKRLLVVTWSCMKKIFFHGFVTEKIQGVFLKVRAQRQANARVEPIAKLADSWQLFSSVEVMEC